VDISVTSTHKSESDFSDVLKAYNRMTSKQREILESAVSVFYCLFGKDPMKYDFDFKFRVR